MESLVENNQKAIKDLAVEVKNVNKEVQQTASDLRVAVMQFQTMSALLKWVIGTLIAVAAVSAAVVGAIASIIK